MKYSRKSLLDRGDFRELYFVRTFDSKRPYVFSKLSVRLK